jgi:tRNA pseudouridine13 synthase
MNQHPGLLAGLSKHRLKQDRRSIRLMISDLNHRWLGDDLQLSFNLPPGGFATCVLRELCQIKDCGSAD